MNRIKDYTRYPIYLDTNIFLSAILESDPLWIKNYRNECLEEINRNPNSKKKTRRTRRKYAKKIEEIKASHKIFYEWEPDHLRTSAFAIGEFISKAPKYNRTVDDMYDLVNKEILSRFEPLYSTLNFLKKIELNQFWKEHWILAEGEADVPSLRNGKVHINRGIGLDLQLYEGRNYAGNKSRDVLDYTEMQNLSFKAPAFEIHLFYEASKMFSKKKDVHLTDALHLFNAIDKVEIFVSNDKDLTKAIRKMVEDKIVKHIDVRSAKELVEEEMRIGDIAIMGK